MATVRLQVESGAKLYEIENENGTVIGSFELNPTDVNISERAEEFTKYWSDYDFSKFNKEETDIAEIQRLSHDLADKIDYILGYDAHSNLFRHCSPIADVGGEPFAFKIIALISDIISEASDKISQESAERVAAATADY